jgi:hypothetical protein
MENKGGRKQRRDDEGMKEAEAVKEERPNRTRGLLQSQCLLTHLLTPPTSPFLPGTRT